MHNVELAIIGGTGADDPNMTKILDTVTIDTPYGPTSSPITIAEYAGKTVAFLARHGERHQIPPHKVPYRANIWALKKLGIKRILVSCAVGSLQENYKRGELAVMDQFIDFTKKRDYTFYDGDVVQHVSTANPFCQELRQLAIQQLKELQIPFHDKATCVCIEGPRFSTRAESIMFKDALKAHVIGMTVVPECVLAREMEICYLAIAAVTDYDAWKDEPVNVAMVEEAMKTNSILLRQLFSHLIPLISNERNQCECPLALQGTSHTEE